MFISEAKNEMYTKDDFEKAIRIAPSMTYASDEAYHSFQNISYVHRGGLGAFAIAFAINWARLMESEMQKGEKLQEVIEKCACLASFSVSEKNYVNVSWARNLLIVHWKYGDCLMTDAHKKIYGCKPDMTKFYMSDAAASMQCKTVAS